jgi:hypothetical protein
LAQGAFSGSIRPEMTEAGSHFLADGACRMAIAAEFREIALEK